MLRIWSGPAVLIANRSAMGAAGHLLCAHSESTTGRPVHGTPFAA
jgi:hypothetical protein